MEASDATGNEPWIPMVSYGATNRAVYYEIQNMSLSASEVWRLGMRFVKEGGTNEDQIWTSPKLSINGRTLMPMRLQTNFQNFQLLLDATQNPFPNTIRVKLNPPAANTRLALLRIVDDQGRKVDYLSGGFEDFGFDCQWKIPVGAEWVRVTVHLVETRNFEFTARPTQQ